MIALRKCYTAIVIFEPFSILDSCGCCLGWNWASRSTGRVVSPSDKYEYKIQILLERVLNVNSEHM